MDWLREERNLTVEMAISKIIRECGLEVLKQPRKVISCVMDYAEGEERAKKMLRIVGENGVFELVLAAKQTNDHAGQNAILEKAVKVLEEEAFFSEENARYIVVILAKSVGITHSALQFKPKNGAINFAHTFPDSKYQQIIFLQKIIDSNSEVTEREKSLIVNFGRAFLEKGDYKNGIKWIKFAADHGACDTGQLLGYCYEHGIGVPKNLKLARVYGR